MIGVSLPLAGAAQPSLVRHVDERVVPLGGHQATIAGRFDATCRTRAICTDRAPLLRPVAIAADGLPRKPLASTKEH